MLPVTLNFNVLFANSLLKYIYENAYIVVYFFERGIEKWARHKKLR